jgi:hypothetical protein
MKKINILFSLVVLIIISSLSTFAQTTDSTLQNEPISFTNQYKVLRSFAFSFGGGYNPTVPIGNYASFITFEYPIIKRATHVIMLQLTQLDANNYRETQYGPNYDGIAGAPDNAKQKSFFDNRLHMLGIGYHKRLGNRASIGVIGGIGYNYSKEDLSIVIPYTQGSGFGSTLTYINKRDHTFLGYAFGTDFRYGLGRKVAVQAQIMAVKNAYDLSVQVPIMVGFSFQVK